MQKYFISITAIFLLLFSSCVTSVHRLATYDKVVAENKITGNWNYKGMTITVESLLLSKLVKETKHAGKNVFEGVERNDSLLLSKSYIFRYEKNGLIYNMLASLVRLNDQLFLDTYPANVDSTNGATSFTGFRSVGGAEWTPAHSFAKVIFKNDKHLELQFLGGEFLVNQIKNGKATIKHETDDLFDTMVITASSKDLQQFLIKYGNDKRLYDEANSVTLEK